MRWYDCIRCANFYPYKEIDLADEMRDIACCIFKQFRNLDINPKDIDGKCSHFVRMVRRRKLVYRLAYPEKYYGKVRGRRAE